MANTSSTGTTSFAGSQFSEGALAEAAIVSKLDLNNKTLEGLGIQPQRENLLSRFLASNKGTATITPAQEASVQEAPALPRSEPAQEQEAQKSTQPATSIRDILSGPEFQAARLQILKSAQEATPQQQSTAVAPKSTTPVRQ